MIKNRRHQKGFTLIELLVVIAIIAILAVVVVLTLNPAELLRQARDSNRTSDFATLKSAIGLYAADVATSSPLGAANTIYVSSLSTAAPTYANLTSLSTTTASTSAWGFNETGGAVASTTSSVAARAINGTGWVPINFSLISSGAPIGSLPVDPVNNVSSSVYAFSANGGSTYKLATKTESQKYSNGGTGDIESTDGGNSAWTYEQGTNLTGL
jgi:prepilin-type N-terminal cleavage/methylation domain-containing protein